MVMESVMTDYQYRSMIKMALKIVQKSKDKEEAEAELKDLLKDTKESKNSE